LFAEACHLMPGGVSSPVRAFKGVGGTPLFIRQGKGCRVVDADGNSYIDYVGSYGPLIAGHAHEAVVSAVTSAMQLGSSYGAPTEREVQLASLITAALPSVEMVRFVNSGTEATMSALRLARAATGRELVVKCKGCYHGHVDSLLVQAGSGALTLGTPSSPGVPSSVAGTTLLIPYNDLDAAAAIFAEYGPRIACFALEAIAGNMGVIRPAEGYVQGLRKLCDQYGALLLVDEVMTGFRVDWGGAQTLMGVRPDLTCIGKIVGGGLPLAAYGGKRTLMEKVSPSGPVYQAGTLSGNPLATAAGLATLEICRQPQTYPVLEERAAALEAGLQSAAREAGVAVTINRVGSMLTPFFVRNEAAPVRNLDEACACNTEAFGIFFHAMLEQGVYLPPSQFEAWFVSLAHTPADVEATVEAARKAFARCAGR
jgi:glutamate-1-semialdehyde 2,1-aminomutase